MSNTIKNKIDFALVISVKNANPNGDPLNDNRPRMNYDSIGEISDVCLKRKIRNRLKQNGHNVFVQMAEDKNDNFNSLSDRFKAAMSTLGKDSTHAEKMELACLTWLDVRTFGQVFAFKGDDGNKHVRGAVSIQSAFSVDPIIITQTQITKSVNGDPMPNGGMSPDRMGMKHRVDFGVYVTYGSINVYQAAKTGLTDEDVSALKEALITLFQNDASAARPEGSIAVEKLVWWQHNCSSGQYNSAIVHRSLKVKRKEEEKEPTSIEDYDIHVDTLGGLYFEEFTGE